MKRSPFLVGVLPALSILVFLVGCGSPEPQRAQGSWAQWRGPDQAGVTALDRLPVEWTADSENVRWKVELPVRGASQPIVSEGRIYLTGAKGPKKAVERSVVALDARDGSLLWETSIATRRAEKIHYKFGSFANPTPVTDGQTIWSYFGGYLAAVSRDGELLWNNEVNPTYNSESRYGAASSAVLVGRAVVVYSDDEWGGSGDDKRPTWVAAYDRDTGEEIWRNEWTDTCCSYSTPFIRETPAGPELLLSSSPYLRGLSAETGEVLWEVEQSIIQVVPSIVMTGDILIQAGSVHEKKILAYRLDGYGKDTKAEVLWEELRAAPDLASPVIYDGVLYAVTEGGVLSSFNPETGKLGWRKRLPAAGYRSAIVAGDGKLYLSTLGSVTAVVEAAPKFKLLATNDLETISESSMAVAEQGLIIRSGKTLYCIGRSVSG